MHLTNWRDFLKFLRPVSGSAIRRQRARQRTGEAITSVEPLEVRVLPAATVLSIEATNPPPGGTIEVPSVTYTVTFDRDVVVAGVDASDFRVVTTGTVHFNPTLNVASIDHSTYTVTIQGLGGTGELRLDLIDNDSIQDEAALQGPPGPPANIPLGTAGLYNGSFQGDTYHLGAKQPKVVSIDRIVPPDDVPYATTISYRVQFTESVAGVDAADFELVTTGTLTVANPLDVTGSASVYTVTISGIKGNGTLGLNLVDDGSIRDAFGNRLAPSALQFVTPQSIAIGGVPRSVATADMNGDGFTDIVASAVGGVLSVELGNGDGTFRTPITYTLAGSPGALAVRDLNGDGNPDVVVIDNSGNTFEIYQGNGDGTLVPSNSLSTGIDQSAIVLEFADKDGFPDILITNFSDNRADVISNDGSGALLPDPSLNTGNGPTDIATGDVNGDGYVDVVISNSGDNSVSVYLSQTGDGFGSPVTFPVGSLPSGVALGDVDGDGDLDLVTSNQGSDNVSLLLGNGNGTFQTQIAYPAGSLPSAVAVMDINGDGRSDVLVSNSGDSTFGVLLGNTSGVLISQQAFSASPVPGELAIGDFNRDGRLDVLIAETEQNGVRLALNTSTGGFVGQVFARSNADPSITTSAEVMVPENTPATADIVIISASDTDTPPQTLIYDISGNDAGRFTFNPATRALRFKVAPDYEVPVDGNNDNTYQLTIKVDDGFGGVTEQALMIIVQPVNDNLPVFTNGNAFSVAENSPAGNVIVVVNATDADDPSPTIGYTLSGPDANKFELNEETHELRFVSSPDYEIPTDADGNNVYTVIVTANDGDGGIQTQTVNVSVTPLNDNFPIFAGPTSAEVPENTPNSTVVLTINATDADRPGDTLAYSLTGPDAGQFTINATTGAIRFVSSPNFEIPTDANLDNVYETTVVASDIPGSSTSENVTITVTPVNDNSPQIDPPISASVFEDTPASNVVLSINASDADRPLQTLNYTISGTDSAQFSIDSGTGEIRFQLSPDFDVPGDQDQDNVYEFIVSVSDGSGAITNQPVTITVLPLNDFSPNISSPPTATIPENTPASTVVLDVNATDADVPLQTLSYALSGDDADLFSINGATGEIRFIDSPDYELPADLDGDNVYDLVVTVSDGNGGATTQTLAITVSPVNDNPLLFTSPATIEIDENFSSGAIVLDADAADADLPPQTITYALSGADAGLFSIDPATGEIQFLSSPDFELPGDQNQDNIYELIVTATEGSVQPVNQTVTITVKPVNDNPTSIEGPFAASVPENTSTQTVVLTIVATDADRPSNLIYQLSGTDADKFSINSATGEIRFAVIPDYEIPVDSDVNNLYEFLVTVIDGFGDGISRAVAITVLPVNDNTPQITSPAEALVEENVSTTTVVLDVDAIDADVPAQSFSYSLSGVDAGLFTINSNGEIFFRNSPNFELPEDDNGDGNYSISVTVTDSVDPTRSMTQAVTLTVTDVNESPTAEDVELEAEEDTPSPVQLVGKDPDAGTTFAYTIVDQPSNGILTVVDAQTGEFIYTPNSGYLGPDSFTYQVSDGIFTSNTATVSINVTVGNSPPVAEDATVSIPENLPNGTPVATVAATDDDVVDGPDSDVITYAITGGNTNGAFSIDPSNGEIRVANKDVLNFEVRQQIVLQVTVTDLLGQSDVATITFNVTNVNEPLIIGLPDTDPLTYRTNGAPTRIDPEASVFDEDLTRTDYRGGRLTISVHMTDPNQPDDPNDRLGLPVEGSGAGKISIVSNYIVYDSPLNIIGTIVSGLDGGPLVIDLTTFADDLISVPALLKVITFYNVSNNPLPGARTITFDLVDGPGENSGTKSKQLNFITSTESTDPVIVPGDAIVVTLGSSPVLIAGNATITDIDSANLKGGRLRVTPAAGANPSDRLRILRTGGIKVSGKNVLFNGNKIGRLTATRNSITVDFTTDNATVLAVQQLLRSLTFSTTSKFSGIGPRTYDVTVSDGGGGQFTTTQTVSVVDRGPRSRH